MVTTNDEGYAGLGRSKRRLMKQAWRRSGQRMSLKEWARRAPVGDLAHVWIRSKQRVSAREG